MTRSNPTGLRRQYHPNHMYRREWERDVRRRRYGDHYAWYAGAPYLQTRSVTNQSWVTARLNQRAREQAERTLRNRTRLNRNVRNDVLSFLE